MDHPPEPAIIVDTGVHFALETYLDGFLVTDGHHNRVLQVSQNGSIDEVATFENVVPTGLETVDDDVYVTQLGPIPHLPENGKVVALRPNSETREVASGASMLIDVERGPHDQPTRAHRVSGAGSVKAPGPSRHRPLARRRP